jgi:hypothetical protein
MPDADKGRVFSRLAALLRVSESGGPVLPLDPASTSELIGLQLCVELVRQFSADNSVAVGLSFEFHSRVAASFQSAGLRDLFGLVVLLLGRVMPVVVATTAAGL